ncbi:PRTRC system protein E [Azonexus hydrophilus]|uniref:PRTRC system protein E n=1 Tax=Azonexus hydrophilus TaxID=418702 RepID=A0ABZ2XPY8_9RHOO
MFFVPIEKLLEGGTVKIELSRAGNGEIRVITSQQGEGALAIPLPLTATAEELDKQYVELVTSFERERKSLADQLAQTAAVLEAAKKVSGTAATKALVKSAGAEEVCGNTSNDEDEEVQTAPANKPDAGTAFSGIFG